MKIERKCDSKKTPFGDLEFGDTFICDGCVHMKISGNFANAVNLEKNRTIIIDEYLPCTKLKATLIWEEDDE